MAQVQGHLLRHRAGLETVSDVPAFLSEVKAAQKRRDEYEKKLAAMNASDSEDDEGDNGRKKKEKDRKKKSGDAPTPTTTLTAPPDVGVAAEPGGEDAAGTTKEVAVAAAAAAQVEVGTVIMDLSKSISGLDNASLEEAATAGSTKVRKRNKKKKNLFVSQ